MLWTFFSPNGRFRSLRLTYRYTYLIRKNEALIQWLINPKCAKHPIRSRFLVSLSRRNYPAHRAIINDRARLNPLNPLTFPRSNPQQALRSSKEILINLRESRPLNRLGQKPILFTNLIPIHRPQQQLEYNKRCLKCFRYTLNGEYIL